MTEAELETTWKCLTAFFEQWEWTSRECATLVEARRLVEVEMRQQGFDALWKRLTEDA